MNPQDNKPLVGDAWMREQARKAHDIIRIKNPLIFTLFNKPFEFPISERQGVSDQFQANGDYMVDWENLKYRVPFQGVFEIDRYIADKYRREMSTAVINYYGNKMGEELRERESRNRPELLLDKHAENKMVWDKVPRTDNEALLEELYPQLWLGIVRENGIDNVPTPNAGQAADFRTSEERLAEKYGSMRVLDTKGDLDPVLPPTQDVEPPLYVSKKERERLEKEVTANGD